jgi:hypothetical protein
MDYTRLPGLPEVEFYQNARLAAKALTLWAGDLTGALLFNGQGGEDYWRMGKNARMPLLQEPSGRPCPGATIPSSGSAPGSSSFRLHAAGLSTRRRWRVSADLAISRRGQWGAATTGRFRGASPRSAAYPARCSAKRRSGADRRSARSVSVPRAMPTFASSFVMSNRGSARAGLPSCMLASVNGDGALSEAGSPGCARCSRPLAGRLRRA